jgi:predicted nucleic-acid-binding protein
MGQTQVKITADTNVLVRAVVRDDKKQAQAAAKLLKDAELIAVSLPCLCEFVWVLRSVYGFAQDDISAAIAALLEAGTVAVNRAAVEAGLAIHNAGGDFADGLIAFEGNWLGGEVFASFDKQAVSLLVGQGQQARLVA